MEPSQAVVNAGLLRRRRRRSGGSRRLRGIPGIHQVFEFLAGFKERNLLCRHFDALASFGVATTSGFALTSAKAAKPTNLNLVPSTQRAHYAVKDRFQDHFAVFACKFS